MTAHPIDRDQLLEAALAYAEAGWPVFPLRPGTKRPAAPNHTAANCDGSDHRCRNGHTGWEPRATLDTNRITQAWQHRPYGIGIACGPAQLVVVDLDRAKGNQPSGAQTLADLEQQACDTLPPTWTVATPSGGRHLYYRQPNGTPLGNTVGRLGPGIDTRGAGGYVAAPPTRLADGDYWLVDDHPPVALPHWLGELLTTSGRRLAEAVPPPSSPPIDPSRFPRERVERYVAQAIAGEEQRITTAPEGRRNHTLFCASIALGQLVAANVLDEDLAQQRLLSAAQTHVAAGAYSQTQACQTISSGLRRGVREPRHIPAVRTGARR
jgi:hypothetical protein